MKRQMTAACVAALMLTGCAQRDRTESAQQPTAVAAAPPGALRPLRVSPEGAGATECAVAAGRDGAPYVVWVEHCAGGEADIFFSRLDGDGSSPGAPVRVNPRAGEATAWRGDPPTLAVAPDGTVYVGWTARAAPKGHENTLLVSASRDGGHSFGPAVKVNDDRKPAAHGMHSLAVAADGTVHLAWLDERHVAPPPAAAEGGAGHKHAEANREVYASFSTDGGRTFAPNRRLARDACPCCKTSVAAGREGQVYVGWRQVLAGDYRHIAVASSADGGRTFAPPLIVSDDRWRIAGCPVSGAGLAVGVDGALRVLWYTQGEAGEAGLYWSESRDGGRTFAPRELFAAGDARGTPILLAGGGDDFVAVWEGSDDGRASVKSARLIGAEHRVVGAGARGEGELPAAAAAGAQTFIVYSSGGAGGVWLARAESSAR